MAIILVVDDHPLNRHFLATLLSYEQHEIDEAADGIEAMALVRARRPDLIIADVAMPRMDGFAFVRTLRDDPALAGIPVIFYTASYREAESRAIAAAAHVEHVITKPSDPEVILEVVARALGVAFTPPEARASAATRQYIEQLQTSAVRMSALLELSLDVNSERNPERLVPMACHAIRTIFGVAYAIVSVPRNGGIHAWMEEPLLVGNALGDLVAQVSRDAGLVLRRTSDPHDPALAVLQRALPETASALLVPMMAGRERYGWVILGRNRGAFSQDDERFALAVASLLRAAHQNLILFRKSEEQLRHSREDLSALLDASPVAITAYDRESLVRVWSGAAERIFGWTAEEAIGNRSPLIPPDDEDDYQAMADACLGGKVFTSIETRRMRRDGSIIDVGISMAPLYGGGGAARGYVVTLSDITAAREVEIEVRASRERLRALSARVLSIQEEERTRIARELHDELGQFLTAIKIDVARLIHYVERGTPPEPNLVAGILPLIDTTMLTTSRIVSELRPSRVGEIGLASAVEKKLSEFQHRYGIESDLSIRPDNIAVPPAAGTAVFRILEEALTNIARHSGATRAEVRLRRQSHELLLEIRDNGRGIRELERSAPDAYGLIGMRERAYVFGGDVQIRGIEGRGTIVTVRIPLLESR